MGRPLCRHGGCHGRLGSAGGFLLAQAQAGRTHAYPDPGIDNGSRQRNPAVAKRMVYQVETHRHQLAVCHHSTQQSLLERHASVTTHANQASQLT